ncbi:MAG: hypothetical protein U0905_22790 [Pirellulales bacterium]
MAKKGVSPHGIETSISMNGPERLRASLGWMTIGSFQKAVHSKSDWVGLLAIDARLTPPLHGTIQLGKQCVTSFPANEEEGGDMPLGLIR